MKKSLKRVAYIITAVFIPGGIGGDDNIDSIPFWVAIVVCLIGILLLPITIIAVIIYFIQKLN